MQVGCRRVLVGGFDTVPEAHGGILCLQARLGCFLLAIELEVRQRTAVAVAVVAGDSPEWDLGMVGIALWERMRSSRCFSAG